MYQDNFTYGYIKMFRSVANKGWYKKRDYFHLWGHLLINATHKGMEYFWNGRTILLQPGQFITGRKQLQHETGINEHKVDRILKVFETEQQIKQQTSNTSRLISILNWENYQQTEQQNAQRVSNERATGEQRVSTKQECKNDKNDKNRVIEIPNIEDVVKYFTENGYSKDSALNAFHYYNELNWHDSKGNKVKSWKGKMRSVWFKDEHKQKTNPKYPPGLAPFTGAG